MKPVKDLIEYTKQMSLVLHDKMFFVDKIEANIYIDYGCADGTLLQHLCNLYNDPAKVYIGYDQSKEMIDLAINKWNGTGSVLFTNDFNEVKKKYIERKQAHSKVGLILSSVLHEVFSQNDDSIEFWKKLIKDINFNYIIIRDMAYNPIIAASKFEGFLSNMLYYDKPQQYKEFVSKYGLINNSINFCHYLLKCDYTQNWKRELEENYFAFNPDFTIEYLSFFGFKPIYFERFNVPYIVNKIQNRYNVNLNDFGQTHVKLIFQQC